MCIGVYRRLEELREHALRPIERMLELFDADDRQAAAIIDEIRLPTM